MATSGQWSGQWLGGWQGEIGEGSGGSVVAAALHAAGQGSLLATARAVVAAGLSVSGLGAVDATARTQLRAGLVAGGVGGFQGTVGEAAPVEPPIDPGLVGLSSLRIALQGFAAPFPLSALAMALQGFVCVSEAPVPVQQIVGGGGSGYVAYEQDMLLEQILAEDEILLLAVAHMVASGVLRG